MVCSASAANAATSVVSPQMRGQTNLCAHLLQAWRIGTNTQSGSKQTSPNQLLPEDTSGES